MKKKDNTVLWWMGWIVLTILTFFVSAWFWTGFIARHVGAIDKPGVSILWVAAVFGTWMVLLVPLIVVMYNKVDRTYEDARMSRETKAFEKAKQEISARSVFLEEKVRVLEPAIQKKLKTFPQAIRRGHLIDVTLKDGRRVEHVFIADKKNLLGIYDYSGTPFHAADIADISASDLDHLPAFEEEKWLRLDGVGKGI